MCPFGITPIPKVSVLDHLNTGISVLKKRAGSRYTGFRDSGIAIPSHMGQLFNGSRGHGSV
jgi:hypothetical protein